MSSDETKLLEYVQRQFIKGKAAEEIRPKLISAGWRSELVEQAISRCYGSHRSLQPGEKKPNPLSPSASPYESVVVIKADGSSELKEDEERIIAKRSRVMTQETFIDPRVDVKSATSENLPWWKFSQHQQLNVMALSFRVFWILLLFYQAYLVLKKDIF